MAGKGYGLGSVVEVARYRGRFGQLDWVLRRIAGLGVILFLVIHVLDTGSVYFGDPFECSFLDSEIGYPVPLQSGTNFVVFTATDGTNTIASFGTSSSMGSPCLPKMTSPAACSAG